MELLICGVLGQWSFALDGEQTVLERNLQVLDLDARKLDSHNVGVLAFGDVDRRRPRRGAGHTGAGLPGLLTAQLGKQRVHFIHLVLCAAQVVEGVPARHDDHLDFPCFSCSAARDKRKTRAMRRAFTCQANMFTVL
jgi:hypothetical protein